jgi:hypothetical protein
LVPAEFPASKHRRRTISNPFVGTTFSQPLKVVTLHFGVIEHINLQNFILARLDFRKSVGEARSTDLSQNALSPVEPHERWFQESWVTSSKSEMLLIRQDATTDKRKHSVYTKVAFVRTAIRKAEYPIHELIRHLSISTKEIGKSTAAVVFLILIVRATEL